ncbi:conjugated bile acid hydrolase-like [Hydractinia symbiolongicarpus]|uniref:conjugated bile acid hydrolase-like n=1 Tax=Hydractinia symbiolongicarpus TaxID=13093 RepID=UPI002549ECEF|nr:conjugated bile acid hydrolase-like [Hydractinia symbiolongicarpus]
MLLNGYTKYDDVNVNKCTSLVSNVELVGYILGTYSSAREVWKAIKNDSFPRVFSPPLQGIKLDLYYSIIDSTGEAYVLEYLNEGRRIHKNILQVATNSPPYQFHLLNMKNYVHLSRFSKPNLKLGKVTISGTDVGNGLLGVPGDFTPPSRFVRTAAMIHFANTKDDGEGAAKLAFHVLNAVDIPKGKNHLFY